MWPFHLHVLGLPLPVWDIAFLVGVIAGYLVLWWIVREAPFVRVRREMGVPRLLLAYLVTVYVTALGAQLFSYAFDYGTTLAPPTGVSPWYYYLSPTAGPKTLYGCVLTLPLAVWLVRLPPFHLPLTLGRGVDLWTPPLLVVLAVVRLGCFLQGCCYGVRSSVFGLRFAENSIVYNEQVSRGVIERGAPMSPVVPAQLYEAVFLLLLFAWSVRALGRGTGGVFVPAVVAYSVFRFAVEFVRADPARNYFGPLSTSQWVALLVVAIAAAAHTTFANRDAETSRPRIKS